ncbi:MAG: hypothetical protein N2V74_07595 [Candidatus Methanospirare jalkutatii]|nr:MAG: hypothetical protein N2V74_07595 [Candidatus Methanospirare jalkutatii]
MGVFEWNEAETAETERALSGACGAGVWSGRVERACGEGEVLER